MIETLSEVAKPLLSVAKAVWSPVRRLYKEKQAGISPFPAKTIDYLNIGIDETFQRIIGDSIDETWWKNLLNRINHPFITPDFLRKPAIQDWLNKKQVQNDFKSITSKLIMGLDEQDQAALARLRKEYSNCTGENEQSSSVPIDVITAILAAGYFGSINKPEEVLAGMIQGSTREFR